jgi:hypothetical protein
MGREITCPECGKKARNHGKGLCINCYRRLAWKQKLKKCKNCGRIRPHKAYGLCGGCHSRLYHYDKVKASQAKIRYGLALDVYRKITKECVICGFNKVVELHHLDGDRSNPNNKNLVGLCPNCHRLIHSYNYYEEVKNRLAKKGYDVSKVHPQSYANRKSYVPKNQDTLKKFA